MCFEIDSHGIQERYSVRYSLCPCPAPGDKISERLNRLKQRIVSPTNPTGDLLPLQRPDAILATHASDHNAVPVTGSEKRHEARVKKVVKREKRSLKDGNPPEIHEPAFVYPLVVYTDVEKGGIIAGHVATEFDWVVVSMHGIAFDHGAEMVETIGS